MSGVYHTLTRTFGQELGHIKTWYDPSHNPPPPPGVPNQNDALNAAQAQTDALRNRRGVLANIFAGASNSQPVSGKTQLGT